MSEETGQAGEEGEVTTHDGLRLHTFTRRARTERAHTIVTHGLGEHSGRYPHVQAHLASVGITTTTYDLRGHGKSQGKRGYLRRYSDFLSDLETVRRQFARPEVPLFLYGHSLGGQIVVNYLTLHRMPIAGVVLASPWLDLTLQPPLWRLVLAAVAAKIYPKFTQNAPPMEQNLSRDTAFIESLKIPGLAHRRVSAGMFAAMVLGAQRARNSASAIHQSLLVMHGDADPVTCKAASSRFVAEAASTDKQLQLWPDMLHETHNELGREDVLDRAAEWMVGRS